jgi:translocation and assembly module TamA
VDPPDSVGFATGARARAGAIGAASDLAVEQWRQHSYAKARETAREVVANHPTSQLDVAITVDPGGPARYGPVRVTGSRRTDPAFVAYMANLPKGQSFDPDDITAADNRLAQLGVFSSIRIEEADAIGLDGLLPITVRVQDRRPRTIGIGGTLSTIDGLGIEAFWVHRNLFGRAERLRFDASILGLGESSDPRDYDYNFGVTFTRPGFINPDSSLIAGVVARQLDVDTYREQSVSARVGLSRTFTDRLTGDIFAVASRARYEDDFGIRHFTTFGLLGHLAYDRRNDILDPARGYYLAAEVLPFYEAEFGNPALRATIEGRAYLPFGLDARHVLAGRAKVGSYLGPSAAESPPDMLFFAGGGGSVRGYAYRSIGVEVPDIDGEPGVIGGSGLYEASAEFRTRFGERFGGVAFVDAGYVTEDMLPSEDDKVRVGAGLGLRYFTGIGPIRFDLATPIDPRPEDSAVALYIGIGQAF